MTFEYKIGNIELDVAFKWVGDEVEITKVYLGGQNIIDMVSDHHIEAMAEYCQENYDSWQEDAGVERRIDEYKLSRHE